MLNFIIKNSGRLKKIDAFVMALGLAYFFSSIFLFSNFGLPWSDDGFILSLSYRFWGGEVPYRDFIYVRPPLSVMLHSLHFYLPHDLTYLSGRISFWCFLFFSAFLWCRTAIGVFKANELLRKTIYMFCLAGLAVSLHKFPPMPWHTVDGVLFSSLCAYYFLKFSSGTKYRNLILSGAFSVLAAMSKQNFLVMPAICLILTGYLCLYKRASTEVIKVLSSVCVGMALPALFLVIYLTGNAAMLDFINQITATSKGSSVLAAGVYPYINKWSLLALSLGILYSGISKYLHSLVAIVLVSAFSTIWLLLVDGPNGWRLLHLAFSAMVGLILFRVPKWIKYPQDSHNRDLFIFSIFATATAWSSQISWGYAIPALGMVGLFIACALALSTSDGQKVADSRRNMFLNTSVFILSALLPLGAQLYLQAQYPYRESPRDLQLYDVSSIYSKFPSPLYTNEREFNRIRSLKELLNVARDIAPQSRVVLFPDQPLFYFLNDIRNPTSIDWWLPQEHPNLENRLISELSEQNILLIMEVDDGSCSSPLRTSAISGFVISNFELLKVYGQYCLFSNESLLSHLNRDD